MLLSLSFNGIKKEYLICERGKRRSAFAPIKRNFLSIPGMAGAYLGSTETEVRIIEQPIVINGKDRFNVRKLEEDLASWLVTDQPGKLIFEDEPDRVYYAVVDGSLDIEDIARFGRGVITFICPDPYKYGQTRDGVFINDNRTVVNEGTAEVYPLFKGQVIDPITYLDIVSEQGYMRIGEPVSVDETPFVKEEIILNDSMSSLTGWGPATYVDNGYVAGSIASDGQGFYPSSFGSVINPPKWQGPAMKKSLSQSLQDFRLEALVELKNLTGQTGMIEIYLLDAANNVVGKIGIEDRYSGEYETFAKARAGDINGKWIAAAEMANVSKWWQDYSGIIRIERIGNLWTAYFSTIKDGKHTYPRGSDGSLYILDVDNQFMSLVSQVQVSFRIYPNTTAVPMRVNDLKVYKINNPTDNQIPYIAQAGDVIEIDHKLNSIQINGEDRKDLKDFGASFFALKKGSNLISYSPFSAVDLSIEWRERFL